MPESTAPYKACVGCMHLGHEKAVSGEKRRPLCKLRKLQRFTSDCAFSPDADRERKAAVKGMAPMMERELGWV